MTTKKRTRATPKKKAAKATKTSRATKAAKTTKKHTCLTMLARSDGATIEQLQKSNRMAVAQRAGLPRRGGATPARSDSHVGQSGR